VADKDEQRGKHLTRVLDALKKRKEAGYDDMWSKLIRLYGLKYDYPEIAAQYEDVVAPNMAFSTVNVVIPSVAVNYPKITVTASKPEDEMRAPTVEAAANYMWRKYNAHEEFRLAITDKVITGIGWLKTIWDYQEETRQMTEEEYALQVQQALIELQSGMQNAMAMGVAPEEFPSEEDVIASVPTETTVVTADKPLIQRVSVYDIVVDPDATRLSEARWIAHRMFIPIDVAKADKRFKAKVRKELVGQSMAQAKRDVETLGSSERRTEDPEWAVVYEYYDLIAKTVCTFSESGGDGYLIDPAPIPYAFGHPFQPVMGYTVPDQFYPVGDVEAMFGLQEELAMVRTQLTNDRKRFMRKILYKKDGFSATGLDSLQSPHDNEFVEVVSDAPFSDLVAPMPHEPMTPEAYNQSAMLMDDIDVVTGVTEYQRGSVAEIRRTATEAGLMQDGANARAADSLAKVEKAIGEVAERTVALCQQYLSTEQVAKIVGEDGVVTWVNYTAEDIAGEYDFVVEAGSTQPMNETFRRQSAMQLMDAVAPLISMGVVNPMAIADHVLRMGFGIKDTSQFIQAPPPPPPMEGEEPMGPPPPEGAML